MLKLIVFDCDGVMFDSKQANTCYYNALLNHFGLPPMTADEEDFVHMHNVSSSIAHIFRNAKDVDLEEVDRYRSSISYEPFLKYMHMEPDLRDFLDAVHPKYHLAISTNRTTTMMPLLRQYNLDRYFGVVKTALTATRPKPAPDGMLEILEHYGCRPEEALFIGDSILDQQHAEASRVALVAFRNPELKASFHVNSFLEILELPPLQSAG